MTTRPINIDKLPKAAQRYIEALETDSEAYKTKLAQINGETETNTFIAQGLESQPLPKNARIRFHVGKGDMDHIDCRVQDGYLDINAGHRLIIEPQATNHIRVYVSRNF